MRKVRKTVPEDLPAIEKLYEDARAALKAQGVDQWQTGGYPGREDARLDMENGTGYVLEEDGKVIAAACLAFGRDPTYEIIEQGAWKSDPREYGFLHRIAVASDAKGKNAAGMMFDELKRQARERGTAVIRGDTHRDNRPMRRVMEKNGLEYRGIIHVEDGTERLAFEMELDTQ